MKLPKPNIEWHCVVPAPLNDKSYEKLLDDMGRAHEVFAKTVGLNGACTGSFMSGDLAVLRFSAARRFLSKLHRLDNRFAKLAPQQSYGKKAPQVKLVELPGAADKPPEKPTKADTVASNRTVRQELVQKAMSLGIKGKGKNAYLKHLIAQAEAGEPIPEDMRTTPPDVEAPKVPSFAANTQTMGKGQDA